MSNIIVMLFNPMTGKTLAVDEENRLYQYAPFLQNWEHYANLKPGVDRDDYLKRKYNSGFRKYQDGDVPTEEQLQFMLFDGVATATDGTEGVEPDGRSVSGAPAWPVALGLI
ncbi:hypothetical protein A3715_20825 [Oleiphilus sp. HI0009]|nr:hypothetical protein A3715_15915 [Oleiphilus sp. HI0009]KZX77733.1 hypothetical protein A3715_20825 [Oleiphilus sp. HI0009]